MLIYIFCICVRMHLSTITSDIFYKKLINISNFCRIISALKFLAIILQYAI